MNPTVHPPDDAVPALKARTGGLRRGTFAEQILLGRTNSDGSAPDSFSAEAARLLGASETLLFVFGRDDDPAAARPGQTVTRFVLAYAVLTVCHDGLGGRLLGTYTDSG
jgi:hypothetical protein